MPDNYMPIGKQAPGYVGREGADDFVPNDSKFPTGKNPPNKRGKVSLEKQNHPSGTRTA